MRRLSQSAFLAVVVLLAALPHLLADDAKRPVQVQLDVVVFTCSPDVLAGSKLASAGPQAMFGCISQSERTALVEKVRADKRTKCLAEPKVICMNGRPASFNSGGQAPVPVTDGNQKRVEFRNIGLEVNFLPTVQPDGTVYLEVNPRLRSMHPLHSTGTARVATAGYEEESIRTAADLKPNQSLVVVLDGNPFGLNTEAKQTLVMVTPTVLRTQKTTTTESQPARLKQLPAK